MVVAAAVEAVEVGSLVELMESGMAVLAMGSLVEGIEVVALVLERTLCWRLSLYSWKLAESSGSLWLVAGKSLTLVLVERLVVGSTGCCEWEDAVA